MEQKRFNNNQRHDDNYYYDAVRHDVVAFIASLDIQLSAIIDFGSGSGATLSELASLYSLKSDSVVGYDLVSHSSLGVEVKNHDLSVGLPGDLKSGSASRGFLLLDVLEHLIDPGALLCELSSEMTENDVVIISVPNVKCVSVIFPLIFKDQFRYEQSGILDSTHLRFFTRSSIEALALTSDLNVVNSMYKAPASGKSKFLDSITFGLLRGFLARQTFLMCRRRSTRSQL